MDYEFIEGDKKQGQRTGISGSHIVNCSYWYPNYPPDEYCEDWYSNNPCSGSPPTANCIDGEHTCPGICSCTNGGWECNVTRCCVTDLAYYEWECN